MPIFWQWFFAIIGLVAFIMAFPFFFQLLFAQPRIGISFSHDDTGDNGRIMKLHLMNIPVDNPLLKAFKVSRLSAQDIYLTVKVYNALNGKVVAEAFMPQIELSPFNKDGRVNLPSSILNSNVRLVKWQRSSNSAMLIGTNKPITLQEGTYLFAIGFGLDGKTKHIIKRCLLHIGKIESEMVWDKEIINRILT